MSSFDKRLGNKLWSLHILVISASVILSLALFNPSKLPLSLSGKTLYPALAYLLKMLRHNFAYFLMNSYAAYLSTSSSSSSSIHCTWAWLYPDLSSGVSAALYKSAFVVAVLLLEPATPSSIRLRSICLLSDVFLRSCNLTFYSSSYFFACSLSSFCFLMRSMSPMTFLLMATDYFSVNGMSASVSPALCKASLLWDLLSSEASLGTIISVGPYFCSS